MLDSDNIMFLNFCPNHGLEQHDGTKNECCEDGSVMPMLTTEQINSLNAKGQAAFNKDFNALSSILSNMEEQNVPIPDYLVTWLDRLMTQNDSPKEDIPTIPVGGEKTEGMSSESASFSDGYMEGFTNGYTQGFVDGFKRGFGAANN